MARTVLALVTALLVANLAGCRQPPPATSHASPTEKPKDEADLAFITLPKKAYQAVGIQTAVVKTQMVQQRLTLTGWIMAKPGHEVTLTAPAAGFVRLGKGQSRAPIAGEPVRADHELLVIEPVLTPVDQIQLAALKRGVEGELAKAKTSLQTSSIEHERVRELHAKNLRSQQDLDQAQKALEHAKEDLAAAQDKLKFFVTSSIALRAPRAGAVLALHASPGQYVAAAAPVATIIDLNPVWLRVPVPEFDLPHVDPQQPITITWKNGNGKSPTIFPARPAGRVAQVDPLRHTADFWYEIQSAEPPKGSTTIGAAFYKDQMVTAFMPTSAQQPGKVVPHAAVVYDTHGQSWIYLERTRDNDKQHRFVRQRVELGAPYGEGLIIRGPLADGDCVVTHGAAVLYSREFHKTPAADDDAD